MKYASDAKRPGFELSTPGSINQTEKPRRLGRVGESELGGATVMLPYVGHYNIICYSSGLG